MSPYSSKNSRNFSRKKASGSKVNSKRKIEQNKIFISEEKEVICYKCKNIRHVKPNCPFKGDKNSKVKKRKAKKDFNGDIE